MAEEDKPPKPLTPAETEAVAVRKSAQVDLLFRNARNHALLGQTAAASTLALVACRLMKSHKIVLSDLPLEELPQVRELLRGAIEKVEAQDASVEARASALAVAHVASKARILPLSVALREGPGPEPEQPSPVQRWTPSRTPSRPAWRQPEPNAPAPLDDLRARFRASIRIVFGVDLDKTKRDIQANIQDRLRNGTWGDDETQEEAGTILKRFLHAQPTTGRAGRIARRAQAQERVMGSQRRR